MTKNLSLQWYTYISMQKRGKSLINSVHSGQMYLYMYMYTLKKIVNKKIIVQLEFSLFEKVLWESTDPNTNHAPYEI